eukprot:g15911.t1
MMGGASSILQPLLAPYLYRVVGKHPWVQLQGYAILPPQSEVAFLVDPPDAKEQTIRAMQDLLKQEKRSYTYLLLTHSHLVDSSNYRKWQEELGRGGGGRGRGKSAEEPSADGISVEVVAADVEIGRAATHEFVPATHADAAAGGAGGGSSPLDPLKQAVLRPLKRGEGTSTEYEEHGPTALLKIVKSSTLPKHTWFTLFEGPRPRVARQLPGRSDVLGESDPDHEPYSFRVSAAMIPGHRPGHLAFRYEQTTAPGANWVFGGDSVHASSEPFAEDDVREQIRSVAWLRDRAAGRWSAASGIFCTHGDYWLTTEDGSEGRDGAPRFEMERNNVEGAGYRKRMTEHLESYRNYEPGLSVLKSDGKRDEELMSQEL